MADLIYDRDGQPQGFRLSSYIYALDGKAIGRVWAEKAYRLDGSYVGAVIKNMVVEKPSVSRKSLLPMDPPADVAPLRGAERRRPIGETLEDAFHLLAETADREDRAASAV